MRRDHYLVSMSVSLAECTRNITIIDVVEWILSMCFILCFKYVVHGNFDNLLEISNIEDKEVNTVDQLQFLYDPTMIQLQLQSR